MATWTKQSQNQRQAPKSARNAASKMIRIVSVEHLHQPDGAKICSTEDSTQVDPVMTAASSCTSFQAQHSFNNSAQACGMAVKGKENNLPPKL
jgi:hypothetical protein